MVRRSEILFVLAGLGAFLLAPSEGAKAQITSPAGQAVLMEFETGEVLFCKSCDEEVAPSSMSKLMTVELAFQRIKDGRLSLDDTFTVSERAWRRGLTTNESRMFLDLGSEVSIDNLLKGIIVSSGGDACITVAEGIAGTEEAFAEMMNARAEELGLDASHFVNSHGIAEPGHHMSVRDIADLSAHIIREYPELYGYFAIEEFAWNGITQGNRNRLLFQGDGVDGLKTGHTEEGGYGLSASAERDGRRLVSVVNGLDSENARNTEAGRLLDIGFREFRRYELIEVGEVVSEVEVWGGDSDTVPVTVVEPVATILSPGVRGDMQVILSYDSPVLAPIAVGDEVGTLTVSAPGKPDMSVPVYAAEEVGNAGVFKNMFLGLSALISNSGS